MKLFKRPVILSVTIFVVTFFVYVLSPNITSFDSRWSIPTAYSIIRHGNLNLDEYPALLKTNDYYHIINVRGHQYSYFPIGSSLVAVPFVWVADRVLPVAITHIPQLKTAIQNRGHDIIQSFDVVSLHQPIELVIASFLSALSVLLVYLFLYQQTRARAAAILGSTLFAFGTSMWSVVSRGLWQHTTGILISTFVLWMLVRAQKGRMSFLMIGLALGFSFVVRPTYSIMIVVVLGYIWLEHHKFFWSAAVGVTSVIALFLVANLWTYHAVLPPYYSPSRLVIDVHFFKALVGNLFSPARGLFVFSPWLLFVVWRFMKKNWTWLDRMGAIVVLAHWIVISMQDYWWGGHTYGPRYMSDALPYLAFLMGPVFVDIASRKKIVATTIFGVCVVWSVFVHFRGATNWSVYLWNTQPNNIDQHSERLWDWHHPQFLAK